MYKLIKIIIIILLTIPSYNDATNKSNFLIIKKSNTLDYYKNKYNNEDIVGIIKINNTNINHILVKTNNNNFYLNHNLYKKYDIKGSIFLDYRTSLNSKQINIYGHNSKKYNVIFNELVNYLDIDFYNNHKYIDILDGNTVNRYIIFSINITNSTEHMNLIVNDKHIYILKKSIYNTNIDVTSDDDILILQTCSLDDENKYIVISSKKI